MQIFPWLSLSLFVKADCGRRAQCGRGPSRLFVITARILLEYHGNPVLISLIKDLGGGEYALSCGNALVLFKLDLQCRPLRCSSPSFPKYSSVN